MLAEEVLEGAAAEGMAEEGEGISEVLGKDAAGAERVGDKVKHDFGATATITGVTRAPAGSGYGDKFNITWDGDPSDAPAPTSGGQHLRKVAAAAATMLPSRQRRRRRRRQRQSGTDLRQRDRPEAARDRPKACNAIVTATVPTPNTQPLHIGYTSST